METNEHKIIFDHAIDLEKIAASGQCFRWKKLGDGCFGIPSAGAYTRARQINQFVIAITDTAYAAYWENYFDQAGRLYNKALSQAEKMDQAGDQFIKKILEAAAQEVVVLNQELWEIMVSFMISQNNNIPRIKKTIDAMCEYFGERRTVTNTQPSRILRNWQTWKRSRDSASAIATNTSRHWPRTSQAAR